ISMNHGAPGGLDTQAIANAAREAANRGDWEAAERLWRELLGREPQNSQALLSLGVHALKRADFAAAARLIEAACEASPQDTFARITLGVVRRNLNDPAGELEAIDAALVIDPYFLPALLGKGAWFERHGSGATAAFFYKAAVKFAPPQAHWPESRRSQLAHASALADRFAATMEQHLHETIASSLSALPSSAQQRWREAASILAGASAPYTQQCNQLHVPRLPAVPFFETEHFPWVKALEAQTDHIRAELIAVLAHDQKQFAPYVAYKPGAPVNQWKDLNHSNRWSAYQLWRGGEPVRENLARCPMTAAALDEVDMAAIGGLCPNAMFSALAPHTQIPPHTGETNARVVAHLPLIVPEHCTYRVGYERRRWEVGKVLVFDDTIEHEARNDSDEMRVVLIFDVWNPFLAQEERALAGAIMESARALTVN
ncbi:MAG TPA: aspartyl/asparaginyl beta-hydroxylase domain-containing protein, partial [Verrucomicrobiae bacterium]|nr:aspartyl/asparaginyl beta-hydroxylase domain-containing protein [Verrucomicrobiae bacterium]